MRLRFGNPSLSVLIMFAIIAGFIFYIWDNAPQGAPLKSSPQPTTLAQETSPTPPSNAVAVSDAIQSTNTPQPARTPITQQIGERQEIPQDTTIFIPRAGIYSHVIQAYLDGTSWDVSRLGRNVGHLEGTAWIDEPGNVVLSGHVEMTDGRGGVFAELDDLALDDVIEVTTGGTVYRYIVTDIWITTPDDLEPVLPTAENRLTLITCNSYDFFSNTYLERRIVVAHPL